MLGGNVDVDSVVRVLFRGYEVGNLLLRRAYWLSVLIDLLDAIYGNVDHV